MSRSDIANTLKKATQSYWLHYRYSCHTELGVIPWGRRRVDVIALNLKGNLVVCEVKSCVADYTTDTKWRDYLKWCNKFYFVVTAATYEKLRDRFKVDLKDTGAGVLVLDEKSGYLRSRVSSTYRKMLKKDKLSTITRIAWRGGTSKRNSRRHRYYVNDSEAVSDKA